MAPGGAGGLAHLPLLMMTLRDVTLTGVYTGTVDDLKEFIEFFGKHKVCSITHGAHVAKMFMYMYMHNFARFS